ncbi:hypothetical protein LSH36_819g01035 [Paralvinella palmiformis]|uniref:Uncharacterized protein n=1 Tax=Paralvinella palmiformis TaxID=53620 RepID=A0AAD9J0I3_9ANNE|nr:hypothetical protein LSH36_819g01035 [Paralvinella palmiformis]
MFFCKSFPWATSYTLHTLLCQEFSEILSSWTKESSLPPSRLQPRDGALSSSTFLGITVWEVSA